MPKQIPGGHVVPVNEQATDNNDLDNQHNRPNNAVDQENKDNENKANQEKWKNHEEGKDNKDPLVITHPKTEQKEAGQG